MVLLGGDNSSQLTDYQNTNNHNGVSATLCHEDESLQAQRHYLFSKTVLRLLEAFVDFAQQADADIDPKAVSALTLSLQGHSMMSIAQMLGTNNVRVSELVNTAIEQLSRVKLQMDSQREQFAQTLADIQRSYPPHCAETLARLLNTPLKCLPYNISDAALLRAEESGIKTLGDLCRGSRQRIAGIRGLARSMPVFDQMLRDYHLFYGYPCAHVVSDTS